MWLYSLYHAKSMWYHSLKTRQTVKHINTRNSNGLAVALEYLDKKIEVQCLSREASPLVLDEGSSVVFVSPQEACLMVIAVTPSAKGRSTFEFRAWEVTSGSAIFAQRDIIVKDLSGSASNEGKSKALLTLSEVVQISNQSGMRSDGLGSVFAYALGISCVFVWKSTKIENGGISCEFVFQTSSSMPAMDVLFMQPLKEQFPQLLVGESGGIRVWKENEKMKMDYEEKRWFEDNFYSVQSFDAGTTLTTCQDFQRIHNGACVFSNNVGNLYIFTSSRIINLRLPISSGGHGLFAVENVDEKCSKVTLAVVDKGHTINLYQLENINRISSQDYVLIPNHALFSTQSLGAIAFLSRASLMTCSSSSRTLSLWVGV